MTSVGSAYSASKIVKSYGGVRVLHGVDFAVRPGTVHGLFGHNGAGKSTLLKILAGAEQPDSGYLKIGGEIITPGSPKDALGHGVACVYQELRLIPEMSVTENIFLGREQRLNGLKNIKLMVEHTRVLLESYGLRVSPLAKVTDLSHPEKQMIEVIANLDRRARFLFLDEPTTAIDGRQAEDLLRSVKQIAIARKIGVVLVSHKLDEALTVCDEATVLMGGRSILHVDKSKLNKQAIIDAIVGDARHHVASGTSRRKLDDARTMLDVRALRTERLKGITLQAKAGEVMGIYGLAGAGRTRFCRALYGMEKVTGGNVHVDGEPYHASSPAQALFRGVSYLTEERKRDGFIPGMSALHNVVLSTLKRFRKVGLVDHAAADRCARKALSHLQTRGALERPVTGLSGGNQQKVLFARIIEQDSKVILLDEPTKGVDIGAKGDIYEIIRRLADEGRCIIVVSSEEEEILEVADRVTVFRHGVCDSPPMNIEDVTITHLRHAAWA